MSKIKKTEIQRRIRSQIDFDAIPSSWDEFQGLDELTQERTALILSILIGLFDYEQVDFVVEVLMEFEWTLAHHWELPCRDCGLPNDVCKDPTFLSY